MATERITDPSFSIFVLSTTYRHLLRRELSRAVVVEEAVALALHVGDLSVDTHRHVLSVRPDRLQLGRGSGLSISLSLSPSLRLRDSASFALCLLISSLPLVREVCSEGEKSLQKPTKHSFDLSLSLSFSLHWPTLRSFLFPILPSLPPPLSLSLSFFNSWRTIEM